MKRKKILLSLLLICSLLMIDTRLVFAEDGLTWNLSTEPRNYSNSKSSGTICYMANVYTKVCKIFYDDDYEIIFSNEKDGIVIAWLVDEYGTAYFCKELDDSDANRNYQIYYYNRDVTKGLEPLIINNSKVYVDDLHFVRLDGIKIYFKNLICEDNSIIEEISSPSYEEVLESYEKNNNSQETTSPTNEPIIIPSESPSGENQNTSSPSVTSLPTNSPLNVNTATPKNSSSPNQKNTATPSATNSPSSGNSSSSDGTNKIVVKKVKNTTKLLQNGKIVERFVFNKKLVM